MTTDTKAEQGSTQVRTSLSKDGKFYTVDADINPHKMWSVTTILNMVPKQLTLVPWASGLVADRAIELVGPIGYQLRNVMALRHAFGKKLLLGATPDAEIKDVISQELDHIEFLLDTMFNFDIEKGKQKRSVPSTILGLLTRGNETSYKKARRQLTIAPSEYVEERGDIGTEVHNAINAYVLKEEAPRVSEMAEPYLNGFWKFLQENSPKILASELTVYHEQHQWAGTLDAVMEIGELTAVVDHKTGKSVWPDASLQIAAYNHATHFELPKQPRKENGELWLMEDHFSERDTDTGLVLHLKEEDYEVVPVVADDAQYAVFRHLMETFRWSEERSDSVIRPAWEK